MNPFELTISDCCGGERKVLCENLLREVPGRRAVYSGCMDGQKVIVKVFAKWLPGKRHVQREWKGLIELQQRKLNAPIPLFFGVTRDKQHVLVMEFLEGTTVALDLFECESKEGKIALLEKICCEMAEKHSKGALQKDLHLGNFLIRGNNVFTIDPTQMCFTEEVNREKSFDQVALLALVARDQAGTLERLCEVYAKARGWELTDIDIAFAQKAHEKHLSQGVRNGLKKSLRTNKRHIRKSRPGYLAMVDRDFCSQEQIDQLVRELDKLVDESEIIKRGNTCHVSRAKFNGKEIVVKRYNNLGFVHCIRKSLQRSRAKRAWLFGQRLRILGVPTPKPLAFVERRTGLLRHDCFIINEYVEGPNLANYLKENEISPQQEGKLKQQVRVLIEKLWSYRISHGDFKLSNILVTAEGMVLTDLDAMKAHTFAWTFSKRKSKDRNRLGGKFAFEQ